jgi:ribosomal protein L12E/L44/L45/RPP1/RPP2
LAVNVPEQGHVIDMPRKHARLIQLRKVNQMNKLLAALIASFFAVGAFAADAKPAEAAKPAASAAKAEKKAEKKEEKKEAKKEEAKK